MKAPVFLNSLDILRKSFKIEQTDLMAVGRTVECNGTAPVSRTQYRDFHNLLLPISLSEISNSRIHFFL
jgi:hypothetical protein